jgi:hypothetical protein
LGAGENLGDDDRMDLEGPASGSPPLTIADCRLNKPISGCLFPAIRSISPPFNNRNCQDVELLLAEK